MAIAALATFGLLAGAAAPASAATTVLYAAPTPIGAADCTASANACSITAAVTAANGASVADDVTIRLAGGTYALPAPTPTALVITFAGPSLTLEAEDGTPTLDGGDATRLLSVGPTSHVTIDGLALVSGLSAGQGGAIDNSGVLTVRNATFSGNKGGNGGAIANEAIGTLSVSDSTFSHNTTTSVGGGGIISFGTTTVTRSAFVANTVPVNGGGINVQPGSSATVVSSSTFKDNVSGGLGGALSNLGTLTVQSSTIAGNSASSGAVIGTGNANVTFAAVAIGPQTAGDGCNPSGTAIVDAGYNLDTDGTCISATTPATGSHNGTTAYGSSTYADALAAYLADDLADNGGPTQTLALLLTPSPATGLANPAFSVVPPAFDLPVAVDGATKACAVPDQRGVQPTAGVPCSIGSYQLLATSTALAASADTVVTGAPVTYTATVAPAPAGGTVAFDDGAGNPASTQCGAQPISGGTATCTVSYPATGDYRVTATYSGDGTLNSHAGSASPTRSVTVTPANASPPAASPPGSPPAAAPRLTLSKLSATRCVSTATRAQRKVAGRYTLSAGARITYTLQRRVKWPKAVPTRCPKSQPTGAPGNAGTYAGVRRAPTRAGSRATTTAKKQGRVLTRTVSALKGKHRFTLRALLSSTKLQPGRYRVLVQATGTAGGKAQEAVYFWVLRPKRR